jgi:hypothetical protein
VWAGTLYAQGGERKGGLPMRWMDLDDEEVDEYGGRATVLDWAQQRPLVAVVMVLVVWLAFIFVLNTVYGLFL